MRSLFTLGRVIEITGGSSMTGFDPKTPVSGISTDTRTISKGDLFVALKGAFFDGVDFLDQAFELGACGAIVRKGSARNVSHAGVIEVDDPLRAVQGLAREHRRSLAGMVVIGVTGSNGKTAVKDMLTSILAAAGMTVLSTSGSRNSQLGVALTLLGARPEHEVAVIEAGISRPGEMSRLEDMIRPDFGVITLIGDAHAEFLGGGRKTATEKAVLFKNVPCDGVVALNEDDPVSDFIGGLLRCRTVTFGVGGHADARASNVRFHRQYTTFDLNCMGKRGAVKIWAVGDQSVHNAAAAAALAMSGLGVEMDAVVAGLESYVPAPMRLELSETDDGITVINDAYVADPLSSRRAVLTMSRIAGSRRKVAVLGDMLELGRLSEDAHRSLAAWVLEYGVDVLITVGSLSRITAEEALRLGMDGEAVHCCEDAAAASEVLGRILRPQDVLLIKGARALKLERVARDYLSSLRPTRLIIDLNAVAANARTVRGLVGRDVAVCGVIKSHGYGLDSKRIAQVLLENGVDWLAVAIPDEGVKLRKAGIRAPILVLSGTLPEEADKIAAFDLVPVVTSMPLVRALAEEARRLGKIVPVHLKVDTGMGRLGLAPEEACRFALELRKLDNVVLQGLMTHFPSADDPDADSFTRRQIEVFLEAARRIEREGIEIEYRHAANSVGLLRFPEARLDMVRPGLALYGMWASDSEPEGAPRLEQVASLVTKISYLKRVPEGTPISYGMTFVTKRESIIATLPLGYVDGLFRSLSNKGVVLVRGMRAPIVGRVCMDQTMIDVTDVPGVEVGDEVVLFGRQAGKELDLKEVSKLAGTIPYEVLARIDARVPRIHSKTV